MKRIFLFIFLLGFVKSAFAEQKMLGHLLTPTAYTLKKADCTAGLLLIGCGVSDKLTMGSSPFLIGFYNMPNFIARYVDQPEERVRWAYELRYFKTYEFGRNFYDMEAVTAHITRAVHINERFIANLSLSYFYYINETQPFSIRLDTRNGDKDQWNLSWLFQLRASESFGFNFEMGSIGLNYSQPYLHYGASAYFENDWIYVQLGISNTVEFSLITDYSIDNNNVIFQTSHPEVNVQFYF